MVGFGFPLVYSTFFIASTEMMPRKCPKAGLENPDTGGRCLHIAGVG